MKTFDLFTAATMLILVKVKSSGAACPAHYTALGTGCYRFPSRTHITWYQAYFICQNEMNGHLVEIENQQEQIALENYIKSFDPSGTYFFWLGATDLIRENDFRWMTWGNPVTYTAWYTPTNEPTNHNGNEHCVMICKVRDYYWTDLNCADTSRKLRAICETDPI